MNTKVTDSGTTILFRVVPKLVIGSRQANLLQHPARDGKVVCRGSMHAPKVKITTPNPANSNRFVVLQVPHRLFALLHNKKLFRSAPFYGRQ